MKKIKMLPNIVAMLLVMGITACSAGEYLTDRISQEAEQRAQNTADEAVERSFDAVEESVRCAAGDKECIERAKAEGKAVVVTDDKGNTVNQIPAEAQQNTQAQQGIATVNANYDFKPGERTLFETDFSEAVIGNFPRNLEFHGGNMSVVSYSGGRALRANTEGGFIIHLPEKLPERFTLKFKVYNSSFVNQTGVKVVDAKGDPVGTHFIAVDGSADGVGVKSYERGGISAMQKQDVINKQMVTIRVMVDGSYVKVYVDKQRVANMPNADLGRSNTLLFDFPDVREKPIYIADIRVAAGGRDLYSTLEAEGRVAVQDILFDTGKANIQPASAKALEQIAKLLKDHPDLKLLIEGHTDNTGSYETNMKLSKERAVAVKTYLVEKLGIAASRLKTMGLGPTQPTASNDTEEGRADNRRVELVQI